MTGQLPKKFQDRIVNIPTHLQYATSSKSLHYAELLSAVNLMDKEKAIVFDKAEFIRDYGANGIGGLRAYARKIKVRYVLRVVDDKTNITIFKNDLITTPTRDRK